MTDPTTPRDAAWIAAKLAAAANADAAWIEAHKPAAKKTAAPTAAPSPTPPTATTDHPAPPPTVATETEDPSDLRNELADADRLVLHLIGKAWYCPQMAERGKGSIESGWLVWDGKRLSPSEDGAIMRLSRQVAIQLAREYVAQANEVATEIKDEENCEPVDKENLKKLRAKMSRLLAKADQVQSEDRIEKMVRLARMDVRLHIHHRELNADPDLLNVQNGIVHLPTGELLPHDPKHRCTKIAAVPYLPNVDRAPVDRLLARACMVQGDDGKWTTDHDRIRYLQDAIGNGLYGDQALQQFYLCIGKGGDGKGTLFEALLDALGGGHDGYAMKADMQSFVRQKLSGHRIRDDLANMAGARLVLASEINKGEALDAALVKSLSGEDTQRVRKLFGNEFEFRPICTLFMQANHLPPVDSQDQAIWRRLRQIPFGPPLGDDERDPAVRRSLHDPQTGGAALLAWAVEGAKRTHRAKRLTPTPSVDAATAAYRTDMNPLAGFLLDDLRFADAAHARATWVAQGAIRPAFESWLLAAGLDDRKTPISGQRIAATLRDLGCWTSAKKHAGKVVKVWFGVTLRIDHPNHTPETCPGDVFLPSEEMHQAVLRAHKAMPDALLPQGAPTLNPAVVPGAVTGPGNQVTSPGTGSTHAREKIPIGNFDSRAREPLPQPGYPVTSESPQEENKENKKEYNSPLINDLDEIDPPLF